MYSLLVYLLVPVLVIVTIGDLALAGTNAIPASAKLLMCTKYPIGCWYPIYFPVGSIDQNVVPYLFFKEFRGTLNQKRNELIKRYLNLDPVTMRRVRTRKMLDQIPEYANCRASTYVVKFQEDRPTMNREATFREYLSLLSHDMIDPTYGLSTKSAAMLPGNTRLLHDFFQEAIFVPLRSNFDGLMKSRIKHIGQMIGNAILNKHFMDVSFMPFFYKLVLNKQIYWSDIKVMQSDWTEKLNNVLNTDLSRTKMDLVMVRDGVDIPVTNENKEEYVKSEVNKLYKTKFKPVVDVLLEGLYSVIPRAAFVMFNESEIEQLISGVTMIDPHQWEKYTHVSIQSYIHNWNVIGWFWKCVKDWDNNMCRRLLFFVTGASRLPFDGFKGFSSVKFNIEYLSNAYDSYPHSDPYNNVLYLPSYSSIKIFKENLEKVVMEHGNFAIWQLSANHLRYKLPNGR